MTKYGKTEPQSVLDTLVNLMDHKKVIVEAIDRLKKNQGRIAEGDYAGAPCNLTTEFKLHFGAHLSVHSIHDDELNEQLAQVALDYYTKKLESVTFLLRLAATAVEKLMLPVYALSVVEQDLL